MGGLQNHVLCLMKSLYGVVEMALVVNVELDPRVTSKFEGEGLKVYRLGGTSGHDWRIFMRFGKIVSDFNPDLIHAHGMPFLVLVWLNVFKRGIPIVSSIHTDTGHPRLRKRLEMALLARNRISLWLPVSCATRDDFCRAYPWARARSEVFFNSVRIEEFEGLKISRLERQKALAREPSGRQTFIVGMVGRDADIKDWPSFHRIASIIQARLKQAKVNHSLSAKTSRYDLLFLNAGEKKVCNGREAIASMDIFVMTSKFEQLPTTMLECFAIGTPICGFIPGGGTCDIIAFSNGHVREAFIAERNCEKLADIVIDMMENPDKRQAIAEDGRQILENHFEASKNCNGRLLQIYKRMIG